MPRAGASASPSLALIKYWGKQPGEANIPATTSVAVGLHALRTITVVEGEPAADGRPPAARVSVDGTEQSIAPFQTVITAFRERAQRAGSRYSGYDLTIESNNNFPTAAGVASSSSGFAALVGSLAAFFELELSDRELSTLARMGSGSAARSVFGGFTRFDAGSHEAYRIYPADHWPELRILVAVTDSGPKPVGSRAAMERTRASSPYYGAWVSDSFSLADEALAAIAERDIDRLGTVMRASYLRMTGSMLAADPPVIYWIPQSITLIHLCEQLRSNGIHAWETMDAGPQVKILTTAHDVPAIRTALEESNAVVRVLESEIGGEPSWRIG